MADDIPVYLMPVAAILGMYTLVGGLRFVYLVYANLTYDPKSTSPPPMVTIGSPPFLMLMGTLAVAIVGYGSIVGKINRAMLESEHSHFDPYDILGLTESTEKSAIKEAYRQLVKIHHPDKGGSQTVFMKLHQAYEALTDELGMQNYAKYGHPDGPVSAPSFQLALPQWLLFPEGNIAVIMLFLYLAMMVGIGFLAVKMLTGNQQGQGKKKGGDLETNSVGLDDLAYMGAILNANSSHFDVLVAIASAPENIHWSTDIYEKVQKMREEALEEKGKQTKASASEKVSFDDLGDGGWDNEEDEEDESAKQAALAAKKAEEERQREMAQLKKATGQVKEPMEGIDDGVLGQEWVEATLSEKGKWPPTELSILDGREFKYHDKKVAPLDHPGVRRLLCMTMGRINSRMLNTHPQLLEAGSKKLLDQTYFKTNMEYRQRAGILLEACLRLAVCLRSYKLTKTIVEAVAQFKIGCTGDEVEWFQGVIMREYGCLPKLAIKEPKLYTPDEEEVATGDLCCLELDIERTHAEQFTARKVEMFKKQGIPPQVAFQTFREGWWFLVRSERMDGKGEPTQIDEESPILTKMDASDIKKFQATKDSDSLIQAWPMLVRNIAQKTGKCKIQFKAPKVPGKYKFHVDVKSQEFLGADAEFTIDKTIVDVASVERKEEEENAEDAEGDEAKKDK